MSHMCAHSQIRRQIRIDIRTRATPYEIAFAKVRVATIAFSKLDHGMVANLLSTDFCSAVCGTHTHDYMSSQCWVMQQSSRFSSRLKQNRLGV